MSGEATWRAHPGTGRHGYVGRHTALYQAGTAWLKLLLQLLLTATQHTDKAVICTEYVTKLSLDSISQGKVSEHKIK